MTANEAVGAKIDQLMFRSRTSRKDLADALGITGAAVSKKIYGQNRWALEELFDAADFFGVEITDLLPRRVSPLETGKAPSEEGADPKLVAGAGFEPTTSGSLPSPLFLWWNVRRFCFAVMPSCRHAAMLAIRLAGELAIARWGTKGQVDPYTCSYQNEKHSPVFLTGGVKYCENSKSTFAPWDAENELSTLDFATYGPWPAILTSHPKQLRKRILFRGAERKTGNRKHAMRTMPALAFSSGGWLARRDSRAQLEGSRRLGVQFPLHAQHRKKQSRPP